MNLEDVKGVGKKQDVLIEAGIDSVEKLANANVEDLVQLKGIGKATAEKFVKSAKELLSEPKETTIEEVDSVPDQSSEDAEKAKKKQKKLKNWKKKPKN